MKERRTMEMLRLTRFNADPDRTDEMLTRRAALIDAVRASSPGLLDARLSRLDDQTWLDVWHWDTEASLQAALAGAPELPEATAAFSIIEPLTVETATVVDQR